MKNKMPVHLAFLQEIFSFPVRPEAKEGQTSLTHQTNNCLKRKPSGRLGRSAAAAWMSLVLGLCCSLMSVQAQETGPADSLHVPKETLAKSWLQTPFSLSQEGENQEASSLEPEPETEAGLEALAMQVQKTVSHWTALQEPKRNEPDSNGPDPDWPDSNQPESNPPQGEEYLLPMEPLETAGQEEMSFAQVSHTVWIAWPEGTTDFFELEIQLLQNGQWFKSVSCLQKEDLWSWTFGGLPQSSLEGEAYVYEACLGSLPSGWVQTCRSTGNQSQISLSLAQEGDIDAFRTQLQVRAVDRADGKILQEARFTTGLEREEFRQADGTFVFAFDEQTLVDNQGVLVENRIIPTGYTPSGQQEARVRWEKGIWSLEETAGFSLSQTLLIMYFDRLPEPEKTFILKIQNEGLDEKGQPSDKRLAGSSFLVLWEDGSSQSFLPSNEQGQTELLLKGRPGRQGVVIQQEVKSPYQLSLGQWEILLDENLTCTCRQPGTLQDRFDDKEGILFWYNPLDAKEDTTLSLHIVKHSWPGLDEATQMEYPSRPLAGAVFRLMTLQEEEVVRGKTDEQGNLILTFSKKQLKEAVRFLLEELEAPENCLKEGTIWQVYLQDDQLMVEQINDGLPNGMYDPASCQLVVYNRAAFLTPENPQDPDLQEEALEDWRDEESPGSQRPVLPLESNPQKPASLTEKKPERMVRDEKQASVHAQSVPTGKAGWMPLLAAGAVGFGCLALTNWLAAAEKKKKRG